MSNLPRHGIQAVIEGLPEFLKGVDSINKKIQDSTKVTQDAAKKASPLDDALDKVGSTVDDLKGKLSDFVQGSIPFGNQLGSITDLLVALPLPALAAAAAIAAVVGAFLALGNRGAPLQAAGIAFDTLTASIGVNSQKLLKDLRAASQGTASDFDLIKVASSALLGVTGDLGKSLGNTLPELLKIAKVEADATGRSVTELFNNLVEGVKKGTPKLIENTGLIIDQRAAYQDYAKSLGITVAQLSDTDKSMALLGATLDAGKVAIDTLGDAMESNADKLDRQQATITNALDSLAIAVQPAFGVVLDASQKVLNQFQQLAQAVGPIFGGLVSIVANYFSGIVEIVTSILQPIFDVISSLAPYVALAFQTIANIFGGAVKIIGAIIGKIVQFLKDVAKNFFGLDLDNLGPQLFNGAAAAFGSFANGIIDVANKLIFPAVLWIAQTIADFLVGNSPPPKGPLSTIDEGGANVMAAWLDGIAGVSLDPVKQVAQQVSDALGDVGKETLPQVNARLAQLDRSLQPFQNRLDIIKSQFDALNEPAKAALDAIDRQSAELQNAVLGGDQQAAERLRLLDQQRDAIQGQVDAQQALVDRAQIQLALAQAQQAPERALLNIRKNYLDALAKSQPKATSTGGGSPAAPKESKQTGAGQIDTSGGGAAAPAAPDAGLPSVLDLIGGQDKVDAAAKGIQDAFNGAIDTSKLKLFDDNSAKLGAQIDRIKGADIGKTFANKFKGLTDAFNPDNPDSITAKITGFVSNLTGGIDDPNSIAHLFANLPAALETAKPDILAGLNSFASTLFDPDAPGSPANSIVNLVASITGDDKTAGRVADFFRGLPDRITTAVSGLLDTLKTNILDPISKLLTGSDPGAIGDIINQAVGFFSGLPIRIVDALRGIGAAVYTALALPVIKAVNGLIGGVETGLQTLVDEIAEFVGNISNSLGDLSPDFLKKAAAGLKGTKVSFGRISEELPAFLQAPPPPAGAKGGLFGDGLFKVGEKGPEYLFSGTKFGVLPNEFTRVLDSLTQVLAQPAAVPLPVGGNSTTNNNSTSSFVFNGVQSDNDARRRYNYLRAGMR